MRDETTFNAFLWRLKDGEEVQVKVSKRHKNRSLNQNAWYRGAVLTTISHVTGNDEDDLHEVFKRKFLSPRQVEIKGKIYILPASTVPTSTAEFSEYIERIRAWAAIEYGINIPDPE